MDDHKKNFLLQDFAIIVLSVLVAVTLVRTEVLVKLLTSTKELEILGSFIAGMFFTSIFTTAPAIITLGEIANANSVLLVAFFGGLGAIVGDLIIFRFVRDRLAEHLLELVKHQGTGKRFRVLLRMKYFRWFTFLLGGLIIASPFPDELGIGLMGFTKLRLSWFIPLSFTFNFIGILIIGLVAKAF
ncbi:MAG: hypothetical protein A2735_00345 [Candidatus Yanofskybacteria bacterium RIFCSPHIGHO2_01_FULL_41_21]|uniref:TVP38/TMEM64 family membrane protein n=1 Tax=Candidatus Yanofskybacteria bacterium RIFCSPHIGHO2_01_FULL_41_21 TaxID=1802660 RepID=A0A1F8EBG4_9BACT|nr:MAG: hypothetical protein A2735_00345 [Candidatus Yanofskybacteria bacterium RIFCSPHIGHO2_01_FULL_41_21]